MAPKVVNLSGCELDDNELAVLEKGLTFIPQRFPKTATKLQADFDAFLEDSEFNTFSETELPSPMIRSVLSLRDRLSPARMRLLNGKSPR